MIVPENFATAASNTVAMPKHRPGNLILVFAYNSESTTVPSLPAGFTSIGTTTGSTSAERTGYKIAASTAETTGTWTNATGIKVCVYSGVEIGATANNSASSSNTITLPALTLQNTDNTSWVVGFYGNDKADGFPEESGTPTSMVFRGGFEYRSGPVDFRMQGFDSGTTTASWTSKTVNQSPHFTANWVSRSVELKRAPVGSNAEFDFTLAAEKRTSAAVYKVSTGVLVRTLWSNVTLPAGSYTEEWDWVDDDGTTLTAGSGPYMVKVLANNVEYIWTGVIGNTSDDFYGENVYKGLRGAGDMAIYNDIAYLPMGLQEGQPSIMKMDLSVSMHSKENILYDVNSGVDLTTTHVDTDGTYVYWCGYDSFNANKSFSYATAVADDSEVQFSSGSSTSTLLGRTYQWAFDINSATSTARPSGIAVMKSGNYVFVSHNGLGTLRVFNKSTGAFVRSISVTNPKSIKIDINDNLWLHSGSGAGSVSKYTINGDGTISSAVFTITGITEPLAIGCSKDGNTVCVIDGSTNQQVKAYSASTGASVWTLGQAGGYATNAQAASDKFMFNHPVLDSMATPFIEFNASDGSFYVGDGGSMRVVKFNSSRVYQDQLQSIRMLYTISANTTDPSMIFVDYLQFERDHSITLGPRNGSWTFTHNRAGGIDADHVPTSDLDARNRFKNATTISGRTIAAHTKYLSSGSDPRVELVELVDGGTIDYTGVTLPEFFENFLIKPNGDVIYEDIDRETVSATGNWKIRTFSFSPDPTWAAPTNYNTFPTIAATDPGYKSSRSPAMTSSNKLITFAQHILNQGYHLGAVQLGSSTYLWKTSRSTNVNYTGTFPKDGAFDTGNSVQYGGGDVVAVDQNIFWNYHGEFWKNSQTNKWNHYYDNGLLVGQFGKTNIEAQALDGEQAPREAAGNAFSTAVVRYGDDYYIYHCDESVHGGAHEWKVTGLDTMEEFSIPIDTNYSIVIDTVEMPITTYDLTLTYSGDLSGYNIDIDAASMPITTYDLTLTYDPNYAISIDTATMVITTYPLTLTITNPPSSTGRHRFNIFSFFGGRKF